MGIARRRPVCPVLKLEFKASSFPQHAKPMDFEQSGKSLSVVARFGFSTAACEHQKGKSAGGLGNGSKQLVVNFRDVVLLCPLILALYFLCVHLKVFECNLRILFCFSKYNNILKI